MAQQVLFSKNTAVEILLNLSHIYSNKHILYMYMYVLHQIHVEKHGHIQNGRIIIWLRFIIVLRM